MTGRTVLLTLGRLAAGERMKGCDEVLESLSRPREVPAGLEYFSFERFRQRLGRVLDRLGYFE